MIYLDYQSTTPLDPRVYLEMKPFLEDWYGNPHAIIHVEGLRAKKAIDKALSKIAVALKVRDDEIIFTSGATESNNLAILGLRDALKAQNKTHLVTQATEHACVLECFSQMERDGFDVTYLPVTKEGLVDIDEFESSLTEQTGLVSIMAVNNEIGVIQPLDRLCKITKAKNIVFHCDASQAIGRIHLDIAGWGIDLLSISGHKIYGPKGIGALIVGKGIQKSIRPIIHGGGQQHGLRSGTLPTPLCLGLGEAVKLAEGEREKEHEMTSNLNAALVDALSQTGLEYSVNGSQQYRIPGNLNVSFKDVKNEDLIEAVETLCISSGSACSTEKPQHSHVIKALGVKQNILEGALRISFGRFSTREEIEEAVRLLLHTIKRMA